MYPIFLVVAVAACASLKRYGLPDNYTERIPSQTLHYDDSQETPEKARFYQREVYRHALEWLESNGHDGEKEATVVDVGAGAGYKLVELLGHYNTYGIETEPALSSLRARYPTRAWIDGGNKPDVEIVGWTQLPDHVNVVICSDVVEHFVNPDVLLHFLKKLSYDRLFISTPDRSVLRTMEAYGEQAWTGPPVNPSHYREWTSDEFVRYLKSHGFEIESSHMGVDQPECQWHVLLPFAGTVDTLPPQKEGPEYHMLGVPFIKVVVENKERI